MGLLDFFRRADINEGVRAFRAAEGAVLLDVREAQEYASGHIPGSVNLPLSEISGAPERIPEKGTPLFVYCLSGNRSSGAVGALKSMGYTDVTNIGGISAYRGKLE